MTSSGTYTFNPSTADVILNAFGRIQIRPTELLTEHLNDASMESNLLMVQVSNRNPNMYARETVQITLQQGVPTYNLPSRTILIGITYLTTGTGGTAFDRPLGPISATDYAAISNKATQGPPTSTYLNLQPIPTLTFWPTPDGAGPYTANVLSFRQQQDVSLRNGQTFDGVYRILDAFAAGMAYRLSRIWKPELTMIRKQEWEEAWTDFTSQDQEGVQLNVVPGLGSYYR